MIPTLETERMCARPVRQEDAEQVQKIFPQREVVKHFGAVVPWPNPPDGALQFYRDLAIRRSVALDAAVEDRAGTHTNCYQGTRGKSRRSYRTVANCEQLWVFGMPCTGTKRDRFSWGLDWTACPCSRRFCVAIADARKRTFRCAP
jgi:hypothetical protein